MYAETGLLLPYFQSFSHEIQQLDDFCCTLKPNASLGMPNNLIQTSDISDYNLGGEGDLFKAPVPVIAELPSMGVDPVTAAISMMSCVEDAISPQLLTVCDIESSIENGQLLSEVFYECRKDLLAKEESEMPLSEIIHIQIPTDEKVKVIVDEQLLTNSPLQKSVSSSCLSLMDSMRKALPRPSFPDFPSLDFETVYGMRRSFSEGDIKDLGHGDINLIQSPAGQPKIMSSGCTSEDRREKLSRYRSKKSKRNFCRKIKYACRKALADSQPRIRGRFAKTEESEGFKKHSPCPWS